MKYLLLSIGCALCFASCFVMHDPYSALTPGPWRAVLKLDDNSLPLNKKGQPLTDKLQFEEVVQGELPFNFEVVYDAPDSFHIVIINGAERIDVHDIAWGHDRKTGHDTLRIAFPHFDSYVQARFEENIIEGQWVVTNRGVPYTIPFVAQQGKNYRFTELRKQPVMDISGAWAATFEDDSETYKAIGEFKQDGNRLSGTFATETGDYRFLDGTVQGNKFYLSAFDGTHAFLFEGKVMEDSTIIGSFRSGIHYRSTWKAKRDPNFRLANADSLTFLKPGYDGITFSFESTDGRMVSPTDPIYKGKVKIVQIMGSWCPNCMDESLFLMDYKNKHPKSDLAIIGLSYEKHADKEKAMNAILNFKKRFGLDYEVVWAGSNKRDEAAKTLPMLNQILSYPTMIIIDKHDKVRRIHTGFSGPATSEYPHFVQAFDTLIRQLINEK
jgi:thiol-disulfide isomerase/thioredoxin